MPKKREFNWEQGGRLTGDQYDVLGNVRETGFKKLADGIYADPTLRKEARGKKLMRKKGASAGSLVIEESESGLKQDYTPSEASEASRLIRKEAKGIKGILRFKKPTPKK